MTFLEFFSSNAGLLWLLTISLLGLIVAILLGQGELYAKYRGAVQGRVAGGYNRAMKVMVFNRLGAVVFYTSIAFAIDSGAGAALVSRFFLGSFIILAIISAAIAIWFWRDNKLTFDSADILNRYLTLGAASMLAQIFNLLGLTLPFVLGAIYPDYRLTLANSSFILNSIYTLITVYYIENSFAREIDEKSSKLEMFVFSLMFSRVPANVIAFLLMLAITIALLD